MNNKSFIQCCPVTCESEILYIDWLTEEFKLVGLGVYPIIYCPWCRVLLDTNLPMKSEG